MSLSGEATSRIPIRRRPYGARRIINSVFIFNQQGELLHSLKDSISKPFGVCIDSKGRIILVGYDQILLIF